MAGSSIRSILKDFDDRTTSEFPIMENFKFYVGQKLPKVFSKWAIDHIKALKIKQHLSQDIYNNYFKFAFVRNPWDWQVSLYHFMLQSKNHPQHALISKMKSFDEYVEWRVEKDLELQSDFIFDVDGKLIVDFVGKFENLQEDFDNVCRKISINELPLPVINKSKHRFYKEYYNEHTKKLIGTAFKKDIETFNYEF